MVRKYMSMKKQSILDGFIDISYCILKMRFPLYQQLCWQYMYILVCSEKTQAMNDLARQNADSSPSIGKLYNILYSMVANERT